MKIAVLGDVHLGSSHGLGKKTNKGTNTRAEDYKNTLDWVADYCFDNSVDVLIQTGDLFEHRNPSRHDFDTAESFLKKMSAYGITTMVIMGNHDYVKSGLSYTSALQNLSIGGLPEVSVYLHPDNVEFVNSLGEKANLILMPFRDKRMYKSKSIEEKTLEFNREIIDLISKADKKTPTVFVGHNFIYDGSYNDFGATEVFAMRDTFHGISAAFMGHYHTSKVFLDKPNHKVIYTGSMEKNNFGDKKNDKFLFIYDTKTDSVKSEKMPVRELLEFEIDLVKTDIEMIYSSLNKELDSLDFKDKIVRCVIKVNTAHSTLIHKDKVESKLIRRGAHFVSKVTVDAADENIIRDLSPLSQEDDVLILSEFLAIQDIDKDMMLRLLKIAKPIMEG